jgi:transcriptional regulator with XRE-family HTH domain
MRKRQEMRVSQQALADALGVSRQTVSSWENGRSEPHLSIRQFKILMNLLDYTHDTLPENFGPQPIHDSSPFFNRRSTDSPT